MWCFGRRHLLEMKEKLGARLEEKTHKQLIVIKSAGWRWFTVDFHQRYKIVLLYIKAFEQIPNHRASSAWYNSPSKPLSSFLQGHGNLWDGAWLPREDAKLPSRPCCRFILVSMPAEPHFQYITDAKGKIILPQSCPTLNNLGVYHPVSKNHSLKILCSWCV